MELSFTGHIKRIREIDFEGEDYLKVHEVMLAYFLQRMQFISLDNAYSEEDRTLVKLCEKYGVDPHYAPDRLAFFKAIVEEL
jgi:hypothetical protein